MTAAPRLTRARLAMLIAEARKSGARVKIDLAKAEATIDFGAPVGPVPDDDEARALEEQMAKTMGRQ